MLHSLRHPDEYRTMSSSELRSELVYLELLVEILNFLEINNFRLIQERLSREELLRLPAGYLRKILRVKRSLDVLSRLISLIGEELSRRATD